MEGHNRVNNADPLHLWINTVAFSHSESKHTSGQYLRCFQKFSDATGLTAQNILADYEGSSDRDFRRKYAGLLMAWVARLRAEGYARNTVNVHAFVIKSFFKYHDLPLGHVPLSRNWVQYHNRDISKEEIAQIISISGPRERAFFAVMAQSGLRPQTIGELRLKHLEPDLREGRVPCKIEVSRELAKGGYKAYHTYIGPEAIRYLNDYLKTRPNLTPDSYLFTAFGHEELKVDKSNISNSFRRALLKLREKGLIEFDIPKGGKPAQLRLYNLRKWFRKQAHQAGFEVVQFWMGHVVREGVDEHYRPQDPEFYRKLYAEKAMPFLRIEDATPTETEQVIQQQAEEIKQLKTRLNNYDSIVQSQLDAMEHKFMEKLEAAKFTVPEQALQHAVESLREELKGAARKSDLEQVVRKILGERSREGQGHKEA